MGLSRFLSDLTKPLVKHTTFNLIHRYNGHRDLSKYSRLLRKSQYASLEDIQDIQIRKMKDLLCFAYENSHFYRKRFETAGFDPLDFRHIEDLQHIPLLTKTDIRNHGEEITTSHCNRTSNRFRSVSGGTTGPGIEFYNTQESLTQKLAAQFRFDSWAGWRAGDWVSIIWPAVVDFDLGEPSRKARLNNYLAERSIPLQQGVILDDDFAKHFDKFAVKRPVIIRGFSFQVSEAAKYCLKANVRFPHLKGIITTGEPLYPDQRKTIQDAFQIPVFDSYRTREVGCIAQECAEHRGMHINAESLYVEIETPDGGVADGAEGRILVTDLENYAMPFIRYEIGDVGVLSSRSCPCGRGLPLLEDLGGRTSDRLFACDGSPVSPATVIPTLFHVRGILNQFRIIQERYDLLRIQMVKPAPTQEKLLEQRNAVHRLFGEQMQISYEYVDQLLPVRSGKFPFVISKIAATESTRP